MREKLGNLTRQYKVLRGAELILARHAQLQRAGAAAGDHDRKGEPDAWRRRRAASSCEGVQSAVSSLFGTGPGATAATGEAQVAERPARRRRLRRRRRPSRALAAADDGRRAPAARPSAADRRRRRRLCRRCRNRRPPICGRSTARAPILETRFVPLAVALRKLASAGW